jgi:cell division inhibitor SepF
MSNWMKNTRTWLGLGNDPYYDDEYGDPGYDDDYGDPGYEDEVETAPERGTARGASSGRATVRSVSPQRSSDDWDDGDGGGVRVISAPAPEPAEPRGVVRPLPTSAKPFVVSPTGFNDVQQVADKFKRDQPVIINLQGVDRDLRRRLVDFASGLCYGLEGDMEKVAEQVFLLTPHGAEVSDDDRRRIAEGRLGSEER